MYEKEEIFCHRYHDKSICEHELSKLELLEYPNSKIPLSIFRKEHSFTDEYLSKSSAVGIRLNIQSEPK
jgi:hypothetical protein